jgi:hypothetical protein
MVMSAKQSDVVERFVKIATELIPQNRFPETVYRCMVAIVGETATKVYIYHLGGEKVLSEPKIFAESLLNLLGYGGEIMLNFITKEIEKRAF